jgi:hypothetical protein
MYFRKDETEPLPTWICTNSSGAYVATVAREGEGDDGWTVRTGDGTGPTTVAAEGLATMEAAFDFILTL